MDTNANERNYWDAAIFEKELDELFQQWIADCSIKLPEMFAVLRRPWNKGFELPETRTAREKQEMLLGKVTEYVATHLAAASVTGDTELTKEILTRFNFVFPSKPARNEYEIIIGDILKRALELQYSILTSSYEDQNERISALFRGLYVKVMDGKSDDA